MIVPMISHNQTHGLLVAESPRADHYTERDVQLLTIVARSAALAIENSELHKRMEELTTIDELTETYNYRYFVQKLQEEKKRAVRYDCPGLDYHGRYRLVQEAERQVWPRGRQYRAESFVADR